MNAIQTKYKGVNFRSRLEAKWACFFDQCKWPWHYEPVDLNGYIPDFVLGFYEPLLVEVKPEFSIEGLENHVCKIEQSGWEHEALLVGVGLFPDDYGNGQLGLLAELESYIHVNVAPGEFNWDLGIFFKCACCGAYSVRSDLGSWRCRVKGCYDGNGYVEDVPMEKAQLLFSRAANLVQYQFSTPSRYDRD